jgi:6-phosphogluconate dehydrogenase
VFACAAREDDQKPGSGALVDKIQDKTGMKGTGKWTVQQSAELSVAAPTIASALDGRFLSGLKDERVKAAAFLEAQGVPAAAAPAGVDKKQLVADVRAALYASKICSYAQGMNLIRAKSAEQKWGLNLGDMARIWKGGCIIRAAFLGDIKAAYDRNAALDSLLVDPFFAKGLAERQAAWRRVVGLGVSTGVAMPVRCIARAAVCCFWGRADGLVARRACRRRWRTLTATAARACRPTWCRRSATISGRTRTSAPTWTAGTTRSGATPTAPTPSPPRGTPTRPVGSH